MANLNVNQGVLDGTKRWLEMCAKGVAKGGTKGAGGGTFSYQVDTGRRRPCRPSDCFAASISMPGGKIP